MFNRTFRFILSYIRGILYFLRYPHSFMKLNSVLIPNIEGTIAVSIPNMERTISALKETAERHNLNLEGLQVLVELQEARLDSIYKNLIYAAKKSEDNLSLNSTTIDLSLNSCRVCLSSTVLKFKLNGSNYFECTNCQFLQSNAKPLDYYLSNEYRNEAKKWPFQERLELIKLLLEEINSEQPQNEKILDFGAGNELLEEKLGLCKNFVFYDPALSHPLLVKDLDEKEKFHTIICTEVLEHLDDPNSVVKKMLRSLKPNGIIYLTTLLSDLNFDLNYLNPIVGHISIYSRKAIELLFIRSGCVAEIIRYKSSPNYYYIKVSRLP